MIPVGSDRKPFLHYLLENAFQAGFTQVVVVTAPEDSSVEESFGDSFGTMNLSYVVQIIPQGRSKPFGTADALLQVLNVRPQWSGESFCICNSDNLYSVSVLQSIRCSSSASAMPCYHRDGFSYPEDRTTRFAVIGLSGDMKVTGLIEKPTSQQISTMDTSYVSMNLFKLETDLILPCLQTVEPSIRDEKELPSAVNLMIRQHPGCMIGITLIEHVADLTSSEDIEAAGQLCSDDSFS